MPTCPSANWPGGRRDRPLTGMDTDCFAHLPQCQLAWQHVSLPGILPCLVLTHGVARAIDVGPMEVNSADKVKMSWTRTESWVQAVRNPEVGHPNK